MAVTVEDVAIIEDNLKGGKSMSDSLKAAGLAPTVEILTFLAKNYYDLLTDAKFGEGHAERQRDLREQFKGG